MIEIKNLSKSYGDVLALNKVNLEILRGQIVGLFGENGAGKTTLMKCILGFMSYDGEITLDGEKIGRKNIEKISFATSEHSFFSQLTGEDHKDFYKDHFETFKEKRFEKLMDFFDLPSNKKIASFSTGGKNQFEVVLSLSQGADFILMDEPFAGNDIFNRADFYKVLLVVLDPNETILLSTHLIEEVSDFIERAILLHKGEIIGDIMAEELEEEGLSLMDLIKDKYNYRGDRVKEILEERNTIFS